MIRQSFSRRSTGASGWFAFGRLLFWATRNGGRRAGNQAATAI